MRLFVIHASLQNKQFRTSAAEVNITGVHWIVPGKPECMFHSDHVPHYHGTLVSGNTSEKHSCIVYLRRLSARVPTLSYNPWNHTGPIIYFIIG